MLQPVAFEAAISLISGVLPMLSMKPDRTSMTCSLCLACASRAAGRQGGGAKATGLPAFLPSRSLCYGHRFPSDGGGSHRGFAQFPLANAQSAREPDGASRARLSGELTWVAGWWDAQPT